MGNEQSHQDQAKHNKKFLEKINYMSFLDWIVTVMFYTAIHYIDFFLARINVHPHNHTRRGNEVGRRFNENFYNSFRNLEHYCYIARYEPNAWRQQIDKDKIEELKQDLNRIKSHGATF